MKRLNNRAPELWLLNTKPRQQSRRELSHYWGKPLNLRDQSWRAFMQTCANYDCFLSEIDFKACAAKEQRSSLLWIREERHRCFFSYSRHPCKHFKCPLPPKQQLSFTFNDIMNESPSLHAAHSMSFNDRKSQRLLFHQLKKQT